VEIHRVCLRHNVIDVFQDINGGLPLTNVIEDPREDIGTRILHAHVLAGCRVGLAWKPSDVDVDSRCALGRVVTGKAIEAPHPRPTMVEYDCI
jgi:hypothetical protein